MGQEWGRERMGRRALGCADPTDMPGRAAGMFPAVCTLQGARMQPCSPKADTGGQSGRQRRAGLHPTATKGREEGGCSSQSQQHSVSHAGMGGDGWERCPGLCPAARPALAAARCVFYP